METRFLDKGEEFTQPRYHIFEHLYIKRLPRSGDGELGEDDSGHAGLDDDADDRLEAHDEYRNLALLGRCSERRN